MDAELIRWLTQQGIGVIIALVVLLRVDTRLAALCDQVQALRTELAKHVGMRDRTPA